MFVEIQGLGKVAVERSKRDRRMRITVRPGLVHVAVPREVTLESCRAFIIANILWIKTQTSKIECRTRIHNELMMGSPPITDREGAASKIISRCRELAGETGLGCSRITVRNQKTIWGSCSALNNISLNINLVRLPQRLMDYVILHELVHTKIRGHGRQFWDELDRYIPDSGRLRRELKKYLLRLF